jgi:hypothetical protein
MMRGLVTYFLSLNIFVQAITPAMDVLELRKLPALLEHYQVHRMKDQQLSFAEFLKMHYTDPVHHAEDHTTHSELPFGQHHHKWIVLPLWHFSDLHPLPAPPDPISIELSLFHIFSFYPDFYSSVWQPPRAC